MRVLAAQHSETRYRNHPRISKRATGEPTPGVAGAAPGSWSYQQEIDAPGSRRRAWHFAPAAQATPFLGYPPARHISSPQGPRKPWQRRDIPALPDTPGRQDLESGAPPNRAPPAFRKQSLLVREYTEFRARCSDSRQRQCVAANSPSCRSPAVEVWIGGADDALLSVSRSWWGIDRERAGWRGRLE